MDREEHPCNGEHGCSHAAHFHSFQRPRGSAVSHFHPQLMELLSAHYADDDHGDGWSSGIIDGHISIVVM